MGLGGPVCAQLQLRRCGAERRDGARGRDRASTCGPSRGGHLSFFSYAFIQLLFYLCEPTIGCERPQPRDDRRRAGPFFHFCGFTRSCLPRARRWPDTFRPRSSRSDSHANLARGSTRMLRHISPSSLLQRAILALPAPDDRCTLPVDSAQSLSSESMPSRPRLTLSTDAVSSHSARREVLSSSVSALFTGHLS